MLQPLSFLFLVLARSLSRDLIPNLLLFVRAKLGFIPEPVLELLDFFLTFKKVFGRVGQLSASFLTSLARLGHLFRFNGLVVVEIGDLHFLWLPECLVDFLHGFPVNFTFSLLAASRRSLTNWRDHALVLLLLQLVGVLFFLLGRDSCDFVCLGHGHINFDVWLRLHVDFNVGQRLNGGKKGVHLAQVGKAIHLIQADLRHGSCLRWLVPIVVNHVHVCVDVVVD